MEITINPNLELVNIVMIGETTYCKSISQGNGLREKKVFVWNFSPIDYGGNVGVFLLCKCYDDVQNCLGLTSECSSFEHFPWK